MASRPWLDFESFSFWLNDPRYIDATLFDLPRLDSPAHNHGTRLDDDDILEAIFFTLLSPTVFHQPSLPLVTSLTDTDIFCIGDTTTLTSYRLQFKKTMVLVRSRRILSIALHHGNSLSNSESLRIILRRHSILPAVHFLTFPFLKRWGVPNVVQTWFSLSAEQPFEHYSSSRWSRTDPASTSFVIQRRRILLYLRMMKHNWARLFRLVLFLAKSLSVSLHPEDL